MRKIISAALALLLLAPVCALSQEYSYGMDAKRDTAAFRSMRKRMAVIRKKRPTVALVLSGGGAKGAAHISVIKEIERRGIPVDLVVGTSIGGLVGGLYACGYNGSELEAIMTGMDWDKVMNDDPSRLELSMQRRADASTYQFITPVGRTLPTDKDRLLPSGLLQGQNVSDVISSLTVGFHGERDFFKLPIPFACVAADMVSAKAKVWHSGDLCTAMRTTMSIPFLFAPVKTDGMVLVDGGMRNNYPAGIAKSLGADIVIGVDISTPGYDFDEIDDMGDIIYQTLDVLGRESYEKGVESADINIKPDLNGYTLLSFDSESILAIMERGDSAVVAHKEDFDGVESRVARAGASGTKTRKAVDFNKTPVLIDGIELNGIEENEIHRIMPLYRMMSAGDRRVVTKADVDMILDAIYGTRNFDLVTYEFTGDAEPYTLVIDCKKSPANQIGVSLRADLHEYVAALVGFGMNTNRLSGHAMRASARVGLKSQLAVEYIYRFPVGVDFNARAGMRYLSKGQFVIGNGEHEMSLDYFRNWEELSFSLSRWKNLMVEAGGRFQFYALGDVLDDYSHGNAILSGYNANSYASAFFKAHFDSFDDAYFPRRGVKADMGYEYMFRGIGHRVPLVHALSIDLQVPVPFGEKLVLSPFGDLRMAMSRGEVSLPYRNVIGSAIPGRTIDHHIRFIGLTQPALVSDFIGILGATARYEMMKNRFLEFTANWGCTADMKFTDKTDFWGFGLGYAFRTRVGPLRADILWNSFTGSAGAYISLGFDF